MKKLFLFKAAKSSSFLWRLVSTEVPIIPECQAMEPHEFIVRVNPATTLIFSFSVSCSFVRSPSNANPYFTQDFFSRSDRFLKGSSRQWRKFIFRACG
ncbi:hypothetical protein NPIL_698091 [Nephila pilipes]|uniref:Uncharacterized protein n=1 Tax=Nephila pilipes TaxID=299642 RepID=A0A8X6UQY5_NEPPI|nr:hypothetical protein NPIL_698091 [Nephila pilipes]